MELWTSLSSSLEKALPKDEFDTWIKPLSAKKEGKFIKLSAPNDFILNHVKENYLSDIEKLVPSTLNLSIKFNIMDKSTFVEKLDRPDNQNPGLVESFTFDNFVEGKSNHMALAASKQVALNPQGDYNPLSVSYTHLTLPTT